MSVLDAMFCYIIHTYGQLTPFPVSALIYIRPGPGVPRGAVDSRARRLQVARESEENGAATGRAAADRE